MAHLEKLLIALGLRQFVEAFALQIFDQLKLEDLLVVEFADRGADLLPSETLDGEQASLTRDDLELAVIAGMRANHDRVRQPQAVDAVGELHEIALVEVRAPLDLGA